MREGGAARGAARAPGCCNDFRRAVCHESSAPLNALEPHVAPMRLVWLRLVLFRGLAFEGSGSDAYRSAGGRQWPHMPVFLGGLLRHPG